MKSAAVSPTVVHKTLMIQKKMVISGTLFNITRVHLEAALRPEAALRSSWPTF
jgi:hypothetical protein